MSYLVSKKSNSKIYGFGLTMSYVFNNNLIIVTCNTLLLICIIFVFMNDIFILPTNANINVHNTWGTNSLNSVYLLLKMCVIKL